MGMLKILLVFVFALTAVGASVSDHLPNLQYMVKLEVSKDGHCSVCSGSFIDTNWILTAAHCVHGMDSVIAYIGPPFEGNCSTGYEISRNSIVFHESIQEGGYNRDIALIEFTQKTSCRPIEPVRFLNEKPHTKFYRNESVAFVRFSSSCGQSPASLSVHPVVSDLHCPSGVIWGVFDKPIVENVLCVSAHDYGGSCDGDSSTHLFMRNGELIGIMTNTREKDCGRSDPIDHDIIFTHVYQFKSWIIDNMKSVRFSSKRSMVRLKITKPGQCSVCSGSFVNPKWILTSAHCVNDATSVVVDVGKHFNSSCSGSYAINKSEIMVHPGFSMKYNSVGILTKLSHDIAMIKFTKETACERYWVVRLPRENVQRQTYYEAWSQFIRFGEPCNTTQPRLSIKNSGVVNDDGCRARSVMLGGGLTGGEIPLELLDENQMCVFTGLNQEFCIGDTSGHLFKGDSTVLIGIMSRQPSQRCSIADQVTFTQVSHYVNWIRYHWVDV